MPFPQPHEHYINATRGHTWRTRSDGITVHDFAYDDENHNGPRCVTCGFYFCEHCHNFVCPQDCTRPAIDVQARDVPPRLTG
jgi:hypothetical protein